MNKMNHYTANL